MRDLKDSQKCDVGIPPCASSSPSVASSHHGSSGKGKKRYFEDLSLDGYKRVVLMNLQENRRGTNSLACNE